MFKIDMNKINFNIENKTQPKVYINIGALLDVPTSSLVTGKLGETILNGGLGPITAIVGAGNNFKSTIAHYMTLSAADKVFEAGGTAITTYDTEDNVSLDRLEELATGFKSIPKHIITEDGRWTVTNKANMMGNVWDTKVLKPHVDFKKADKGLQIEYGPFKDPYTKTTLKMVIPTFVEIDSVSEFEGETSNEMLHKDLDGSDTNRFAMVQGLFKSKFVSNLPSMAVGTNTYFVMTAQLGEKLDMRSGPAMYSQPFRNLQYLKAGEHIKGVSPKFFFLMHNAWYAHTAKKLINDSTKLPEYPLGDDRLETDLNTVTLTQLRGKNGPSGCTVTLVVSQDQGVLPSLTEFHYIKENKRFGLDGNNTNYHLDLYPDVNLSRTTVRNKLNSDSRLRRAVNITAELHQLEAYHKSLQEDGLMCTPKELYEDLKKLGYDWNMILDTRGYWTLDQYENPTPYLSTVDLLKMRKGIYQPYFLKEDKSLKDKFKPKEEKSKK